MESLESKSSTTLKGASDNYLVTYPSDDIKKVWPLVSGMIEKALDFCGEYTIDDLFVGLEESYYQLWTSETQDGVEAAMVTGICKPGDKTHCLLLALGGAKIDNWIVFQSEIEDWARSQGCQEIRLRGRQGWRRKIGYDIAWVEYRKEL